MSKTVTHLDNVAEKRMNKYTMALKSREGKATTVDAPAGVDSPVAMHPYTFYGIFSICLLVVCLLLVGGYKFVRQWHQSSRAQAAWAGLATQQNEQIAALQESVIDLRSQQSRQLADLKRSIKIIDRLMNRSEREISELTIDSNIYRVLLDDIKATHKDLFDKYIDLSDEVRDLKQLNARTFE